MAMTTVRLDDDDERLLDGLATRLGGRSQAIRAALRFLADDLARRHALDELLTQWEAESGPVDEDEVARMVDAYDL